VNGVTQRWIEILEGTTVGRCTPPSMVLQEFAEEAGGQWPPRGVDQTVMVFAAVQERGHAPEICIADGLCRLSFFFGFLGHGLTFL
jgi:hypothetical protein